MSSQFKLVFATYAVERIFKVPKGLDLYDRSIVQKWCVEWDILHIYYTDGRFKQIYPCRSDGLMYPKRKGIYDADSEDEKEFFKEEEEE